MGKADIFLEEDRISVTGGDVELQDRDGTSRLTLTAWQSTLEDVNSPDEETRAWLDGGAGRLELGQNDEYDIHIPQIWLDGPNGEVGISDDPVTPRDSTILLSADERSVTVGGDISDAPASLSLLSDDATVEATTAVDDERYQSELRMGNDNESGGIRLRTTSWETPDVPAGIVEVFDEGGDTGVLLDGEAAGIKLGYAYKTESDLPDEYDTGAGFVARGKSGRLLLDDGDVGLGLFADSDETSTVFEIRASEGRLEVSSLDADNPRFTLDANGRLEVADDAGDAVFTVDPDREVVEIPNGWHIESGNDTVLE